MVCLAVKVSSASGGNPFIASLYSSTAAPRFGLGAAWLFSRYVLKILRRHVPPSRILPPTYGQHLGQTFRRFLERPNQNESCIDSSSTRWGLRVSSRVEVTPKNAPKLEIIAVTWIHSLRPPRRRRAPPRAPGPARQTPPNPAKRVKPPPAPPKKTDAREETRPSHKQFRPTAAAQVLRQDCALRAGDERRASCEDRPRSAGDQRGGRGGRLRRGHPRLRGGRRRLLHAGRRRRRGHQPV